MQNEWTLAHALGRLETTIWAVADGLHRHIEARDEGIHRRLDYQDRAAREWNKQMLRRTERPRNGHSRIPYGKLCAIGILLLIGIASKAYPEATKKASLELVERLLLGAVKN